MDIIEKYLATTGQSLQYLMNGAMQYGPDFIETLAAKALKEGMEIRWKALLVDGEDIGLLEYEFSDMNITSY